MRRAVIAVALAIVALAGCDQPRKGADGYTFGEAEYVRDTVALQVVAHPDAEALRGAFPGPPPDGRELMAWSALHPDGGCTVHIIDPAVRYQPEWIGHEITHCIYGRWHD